MRSYPKKIYLCRYSGTKMYATRNPDVGTACPNRMTGPAKALCGVDERKCQFKTYLPDKYSY